MDSIVLLSRYKHVSLLSVDANKSMFTPELCMCACTVMHLSLCFVAIKVTNGESKDLFDVSIMIVVLMCA